MGTERISTGKSSANRLMGSDRVSSRKPDVIPPCLVLERIAGADIATSTGRSRSAQRSAPGITSSGVLDFCLPLLQVDVDRTSNQLRHRGPCDRRPLA